MPTFWLGGQPFGWAVPTLWREGAPTFWFALLAQLYAQPSLPRGVEPWASRLSAERSSQLSFESSAPIGKRFSTMPSLPCARSGVARKELGPPARLNARPPGFIINAPPNAPHQAQAPASSRRGHFLGRGGGSPARGAPEAIARHSAVGAAFLRGERSVGSPSWARQGWLAC